MENKRAKRIMIAGILCLVVGFIWMFAMQESRGPFLILASAGGALLANAKLNWKK